MCPHLASKTAIPINTNDSVLTSHTGTQKAHEVNNTPEHHSALVTVAMTVSAERQYTIGT